MFKRSLRLRGMILLLIAGIGITGCAPVFPRELTDRVDRRISFKELQSDPEKFKGDWVMLGGAIVSSKNIKAGTLIEVLQEPLDDEGRPLDTDRTEGRFLVQSDRFLDSAVYHPGRLITFIGEVVGAWADTRVCDNGRWHFEDANPSWRSLHHVAGGNFYAIGEPLSVED